MIRKIKSTDARDILEIYRLGLEGRNATFETAVPPWEEWEKKFHKHSRLAIVKDKKFTGWAALSPFSNREVYRGVAEVSIYVHPEFSGRGIGTILMQALIDSSEKEGIWTLFSSVFPENIATIKLHQKSGFRLMGKREKIARLDGIWRDTLIFERRSKNVGLK